MHHGLGHIRVIDSIYVAVFHNKKADFLYLFGFEKEMRIQKQKMVHEDEISSTLSWEQNVCKRVSVCVWSAGAECSVSVVLLLKTHKDTYQHALYFDSFVNYSFNILWECQSCYKNATWVNI